MAHAKRIGRYEIRGELGVGGMARVYRAFDTRFRRQVALKVLPPQFADDRRFRARFDREAVVIASLEHPAIVPVYDYGEDNGQLFLVMRLMDGGALADRIQQHPLSLREANRVLSRLAPALDFAHQQGIVHRDIKPANILFDRHNEPYLTDFGIVKIFEGDDTSMTGTGGPIGSPAYMSPEQVLAGIDLDGRSDVYSLGIVLYEMLTGERPFRADSPMRTALLHVNAPVPAIQNVRPDLPGACQIVIEKALAKDRDQRYSSATTLVFELSKLAAGTTSVPDSPDPSGVTQLELTPSGQGEFSGAGSEQDSLYQEAVAAMVAASWEVAIQKLNLLVAIDPNYRDTIARLAVAIRESRHSQRLAEAQSALEGGRWDEAISIASVITQGSAHYLAAERVKQRAVSARKCEGLYANAEAAFQAAKWSIAVRLLEQIVELDEGYRDAASLLLRARAAHRVQELRQQGAVAMEERRWSDAAEYFLAILDELPGDENAQEQLLAARNEQEKAERLETLNRTAREHFEAGQWPDAISAWKEVLELAPDSQDAKEKILEAGQQQEREHVQARLQELALLAAAHEQAGEWAAAAQIWQEAYELDSGSNAELADRLAAAKAAMSKELKSITVLESAYAAAEAADWDAALAGAHELLQLEPDNPRHQEFLSDVQSRQRLTAQFALARQAIETAQWQTAVDHLQKILAADPAFPDAEPFLKKAEEGVKLDFELAQLRASGGHAYEGGDWARAIAIWQQALDMKPGDIELAARLAAARQEQLAADLLKEAQGALDRGAWSDVVAIAAKMPTTAAAYPAIQELCDRAEQAQRLDEGYRAACEAMQKQDWQTAITHFEPILAADHAYRDVTVLLEQSRSARDNQLRLEQLYRNGAAAFVAGNWPEAISAWEELQTVEPAYRDTADLLDQARHNEKQERTLHAAALDPRDSDETVQLKLAQVDSRASMTLVEESRPSADRSLRRFGLLLFLLVVVAGGALLVASFALNPRPPAASGTMPTDSPDGAEGPVPGALRDGETRAAVPGDDDTVTPTGTASQPVETASATPSATAGHTAVPTATPSRTASPSSAPTRTPVPPSATVVPTVVVPPVVPPTATPAPPPTSTPLPPPTNTPIPPPPDTPVPEPTDTPQPPPDTPVPDATDTPEGPPTRPPTPTP